jgi:cation diffusion facilitator CzcD-associated flavoprotein CzcO
MSATTKLSNIRRVAVIGAGAGGLVAARALREERCFETIDVLEQRGDVGGVWNYTNATAAVSVPSTDPTAVEAPVNGEYVSAVYDSLGMRPAASGTRAQLTTQKRTSLNS